MQNTFRNSFMMGILISVFLILIQISVFQVYFDGTILNFVAIFIIFIVSCTVGYFMFDALRDY